MNPNNDLTHLERSLKGAPAALFLALVLHGGLQTTKNLCRYTTYSDKVVREGLARLMELGLVSYDSDLRAWTLVPQTMLLHLLQQGLLTNATPGRRGIPSGVELSTELSTGRTAREDSTAGGEESTAGENGDVEETADTAVLDGEDSTALLEDSTETLVDSTAGGEISSSSCGPIDSVSAIPDPDQEEFTKQLDYNSGRNCRPGGPKGQKVLEDWLVRGGIGRKSPKMREILASDPDLETVKAHVLERLAWMAGLLPVTADYQPGLLIFRILNGYPPPPMRCEECLLLPDKLGLCRCDYESLVHR